MHAVLNTAHLTLRTGSGRALLLVPFQPYTCYVANLSICQVL